MLIHVKDLSHVYNPKTPLEHIALRDICFDIRAGERVGVMGPTGCGKTTLLGLIAGLLSPTSGCVLLDKLPAHQRSKESHILRKRIGLAFQHPETQIFKPTVFQEVAFGPQNLGLTREDIKERVHWALEMTGLNAKKFENRFPLTLSGGEMRRVALASVLSMRPQVLLLDEPTAGLDPLGKRELMDRIQDWQKESSATLVIISHNAEILAKITERVILLKDGQVIADGPVRQLLSNHKLLCKAGLKPSPSVALLYGLRESGWSVRVDCFLADEAASEIIREKKQLARRMV